MLAQDRSQVSGGATDQPQGFFADGRVYIVAPQVQNASDVVRVLLHESLGHFGLRGLHSPELNKILRQVAALRRGDVEAMTKRPRKIKYYLRITSKKGSRATDR